MVFMARFVVPLLVEKGGGAIINMASVAGLAGGHSAVAYSTTKAAVIQLTKTMAGNHGRAGVRVNAVAPGFVHTPMVYPEDMTEDERARRDAAAPLGTMGTAWDVAAAVVFLASSQARWITGAVLPVDGGFSAVLPMPNVAASKMFRTET
jgi:NAD(P)-dependent dehydrogenase (short-subunit alcohol dehydrogenase family)